MADKHEAGLIKMQGPHSLKVLGLIGIAGVVLVAGAALSSPRVVSSDIEEVGDHVFTEKDVINQSGERIVIDALLFDAKAGVSYGEGDSTLLKDDFTLFIPSGTEGKRFCVDLASRTASFRRIAIFKLKKSVREISAHIDLSDTGEIGAGGAVMVAFSTADDSQNPLEACLLQDDWIYPARHKSLEGDQDDLVLQFRINSGNASSTVIQLDDDNVAVGQSTSCARDEGKNGLFDRVCRLKLFRTESGIARIKTRIRQRSGLPLERVFNVAINENTP